MELVVVIAVVVLLVAITIPGLTSARRSATAAQCLANIRSIGQVLTVYAADQQDRFPHYAKPAVGDVYWVSEFTPLRFLDATLWYTVPLKPWLDDRKAHPSAFCPMDPIHHETAGDPAAWARYEAAPAGYPLATGVYTVPRLWAPPGGDAHDPAFYKVQQWASVAMPSRKGILYERYPWHDGFRVPPGSPRDPAPYRLGKRHSILFGDLSARELRMLDLPPGLQLAGFTSDTPVATTVNGVLGSDLP